jgi:L-asparagine transporter-like permease
LITEKKLKINTFLVLGFVGIAVTFLLQMLIILVFKQNFENWWVFYIVWFVFLFIGIGVAINKKDQKK